MAQVLASEARDRLRGATSDVPRSPRDLTPAWLTATLCAGTPGAQVISVARGAGSVGTTTRQPLTVEYNDAGAAAGLPTRLFVKCTTAVSQRVMLGLGGFIDCEPGFYTHVRPLLEIEAPSGYFAAADPGSWRSIVITDDVASTRGAEFCGPSTEVTRDRIEDLLATAARWHGALWDSARLDSWRWLKTPAELMGVIDSLLVVADRTATGVERARSVIPPSLRDRRADLLPALRGSMHSASRGALTYLHGDLHVANTYLTGLKGSWAHDYAYVVTTALEVADRRAWERDLLDFYLERLAASGGGAIPDAEAWQAYRRATFYPYFAWLYTIGRSRLQPRFQPDEIGLALIRRIGAAIEDLDSWAAVGL